MEENANIIAWSIALVEVPALFWSSWSFGKLFQGEKEAKASFGYSGKKSGKYKKPKLVYKPKTAEKVASQPKQEYRPKKVASQPKREYRPKKITEEKNPLFETKSETKSESKSKEEKHGKDEDEEEIPPPPEDEEEIPPPPKEPRKIKPFVPSSLKTEPFEASFGTLGTIISFVWTVTLVTLLFIVIYTDVKKAPKWFRIIGYIHSAVIGSLMLFTLIKDAKVFFRTIPYFVTQTAVANLLIFQKLEDCSS